MRNLTSAARLHVTFEDIGVQINMAGHVDIKVFGICPVIPTWVAASCIESDNRYAVNGPLPIAK
ncbi:MAG: hypothetical protein OXE94_07260 [Aestuariivita sp.]|nr:hypothetical protein [Aestuariivita sp.]